MTIRRHGWLAGLLVLLFIGSAASGVGASEWQVEVVDSVGDVGQHASIAVDSLKRPHLSYYDATNGALKYAYWSGNAWIIEQVDGGGYVGDYTSIALDSADEPHITYHDSLNHTLKYAFRTAAGWTIETVPVIGQVGLYSSLVIDETDAHVAYQRYSWPQALQYAVRKDGVWTVDTVDSDGVGQYTSLALDSHGVPHISYLDAANKDVMYAVRSSTGWTLETVDSSGTVGEYYTAIAVDSVGSPHITYFDTTNGDLKYAVKSGDSWQTMVVDGTGVVGPYSSLGLDGLDQPCVSYFDNTNADLKYAQWTADQGWRTETVDADGRVGSYTGLALDQDGYVHIGYYDISNGDLKYALETMGANLPAPDSSVSPSTVDFGMVPLGATSTRQVEITNQGDADLLIEEAAVEGAGFSIAADSLPAAPLGPGESAVLTLQFSPGSLGESFGSLSITCNDPDEGTVVVGLAGDGSLNATVDLKPDTLNLGSNRDSLTVYVELPSGWDLHLTDISTVTLTAQGITVLALETPHSVGDFDSDGLPDLMVKFPAQSMLNGLSGDEFDAVVTGILTTGETFKGTDVVQTTGSATATSNKNTKGPK